MLHFQNVLRQHYLKRIAGIFKFLQLKSKRFEKSFVFVTDSCGQ